MELTARSVELPSGELRLLQPRESAELPDDGGVEWAPIAPYWSVLWRSGVALATDSSAEALALVTRNAEENGVRIETAAVDWDEPDDLVKRAPFDLVIAADVLYERASVTPLLALLPRLAPEAWLADPGRPPAEAFLARETRRWPVETSVRGVVRIGEWPRHSPSCVPEHVNLPTTLSRSATRSTVTTSLLRSCSLKLNSAVLSRYR